MRAASHTLALLSAAAWHSPHLTAAAARVVHTALEGCGGRLDNAAAAQQLQWLSSATSPTTHTPRDEHALPMDDAAFEAALHSAALSMHQHAATSPLHALLCDSLQQPPAAAMVATLPLDTCAVAAVVHAATTHTTSAPPTAKAAQLRCLAQMLQQSIVDAGGDASAARAAAIDDEWRWLAARWCCIVNAHRESIPAHHHAAVDAAVQQLRSDALQDASNADAATATGLLDVAHVATALQASTHPLFLPLVTSHMLPVLQLLCRWRAGLDASCAARGEACCLLGAGAMQLLVPPMGVDPARAASLQLDVLQDCWLRSVQADIEVLLQWLVPT